MNQSINEKINYFYKANSKVHIPLNNGNFRNGYIMEISGNFILLKDDIIGEMPLFFSEIKDVLPYKEREEI